MTPEQAERNRERVRVGAMLAPLLEPAVRAWFVAGDATHVSAILSAPNDTVRREATANLRAHRALLASIERAVADGERARKDIEKTAKHESDIA